MHLLRTALLVLAASLGLAAQEDAACLKCHGPQAPAARKAPKVDPKAFQASVHGSLGCTGCHSDLAPDHAGKVKAAPVSCAGCHEKASSTFEHSAHFAARKAGNTGAAQCGDCHGTHDIVPVRSTASPVHRDRLIATCGQCHPDIAEDLKESVHGKAMAQGVREAPICTDCHSDHAIQRLKGATPLQLAEEVCSGCHGSKRMNTKLGLATDRVSTFFDSYHGLAARMGSPTAANCASCHGFHRILPSSDPRSSVHPSHLLETCRRCHTTATERFIQGKIHVDEHATGTLGEKVNTGVRRLYIGMITLVIGGMLVHNFLALRKKALAAKCDPNRTVVRMSPAARIQHGLLATSFIYLVISGFALRYPDSWLGWLMGSSEAFRRISHRVAAVVMMVLSVGHLWFMFFTREGRTFVKDMLPTRQDILDVPMNLWHFVRPGAPRPRFGRFGYAEKAEYWAVVWGTAVMAGTGCLIWFKIDATRYAARWVVDVATTIHYYEAILATLAIIVWHFWSVVFDPDIYPLNWAFWDGRITRHHQEHEHPLEQLNEDQAPADDTEEKD